MELVRRLNWKKELQVTSPANLQWCLVKANIKMETILTDKILEHCSKEKDKDLTKIQRYQIETAEENFKKIKEKLADGEGCADDGNCEVYDFGGSTWKATSLQKLLKKSNDKS